MLIGRLHIRPMFAWYDFWIGGYLDTDKKTLYFLPVPMAGFVFRWVKKPDWFNDCICSRCGWVGSHGELESGFIDDKFYASQHFCPDCGFDKIRHHGPEREGMSEDEIPF